MDTSTAPRVAAIAGGFAGIAADVFLVLMFTVEGGRLGPLTFGHVNDALTVVQFALLVPVVLALGRRLPASPGTTIATVLGAVAAAACALLSVLLIAGVLTFAQQIGPQMLTIVIVLGWLLTIGLIGRRTRAVPRAFALGALLVATGALLAAVLVALGWLLPAPFGSVVQVVGYAVGGLAWFALPVLVLLSARVLAPAQAARVVPVEVA